MAATYSRKPGPGRPKRKVKVERFRRMDAARVPPELRESWAIFLRESGAHPGTRRAIFRVLAFTQPWREACRAEGVSYAHAWEIARAYALAGRTRKAIGDGFSRIVAVGQDLLESKLQDRAITDDLSVRDVTAVVSTAGAQLAKAWEAEDQGTQYLTALDRLAERLGTGGGTVRLELTVSPADPTDRAVDVTPLPAPALSE